MRGSCLFSGQKLLKIRILKKSSRFLEELFKNCSGILEKFLKNFQSGEITMTKIILHVVESERHSDRPTKFSPDEDPRPYRDDP